MKPEGTKLEVGVDIMSLDEERKVPLQAISSSPRIGAMVSLAGVALTLLGYFLPMFTQSNPQVPGSAHGVYEWQAINLSSNLVLTTLHGIARL
jgi:hypothetical protein